MPAMDPSSSVSSDFQGKPLCSQDLITSLETYIQSLDGSARLGTKTADSDDADRKRLANLAAKLLQLCTDPTEILDQYASNVSSLI